MLLSCEMHGFTGQNQKTLSMACDMRIMLSDYHVSVYFTFEAKADIQIKFRNRAVSTRFLVLAMAANSLHSGCKQNYRGEHNYCTIWPDNVRSIKRRHCAIIKWKPLLDNTNRLSAKLFSKVVFLFILKGLIVVRPSARMAPRSWADSVSWGHIRSPSGEMEPFKKTARRPANRNKRAMTSSAVPQHRANDSSRQSRVSSESGTVAVCDLLPCHSVHHMAHMQPIYREYVHRNRDTVSLCLFPVSTSWITVSHQSAASCFFFFFYICVPWSHPRGTDFCFILVEVTSLSVHTNLICESRCLWCF